jgi:translation initiation factor 3 subunit C
MLSHIFHHALNDDFHKARDMLLMSHVQNIVFNTDVETQILYNRTIAQLGLSAFRNGLVDETESILRDLYANSTLVRERLAQGTQRRMGDSQVSPEQEKLEQARQLPFHLHLNTELLECAYLVSAMLVEVSQIAYEAYDPERKREVRSRTFRRMLENFDRQVFTGPPENKREYITQSAKALQQGDWQKSIELVHSIKSWALLPNEQETKDMLAR